MKLELHHLGSHDTFDFCVIGAGPAGIACALTLAAAPGRRVLLLEGGSKDFSRESQQIYAGTTTGDPYFNLTATRLRYFGGTSNHWNGLSRTLDCVDFQKKGNTKTEWPISKNELDVYLKEASAILELPEIPDDRPLGASGLNRIDFVWSPPMKFLDQYFPVRFSKKYFDVVVAHQNIFLILNANVTAFETNGSDVTSARVEDFSGNAIKVHANRFVLATGGIENSRILLWSNELSNGQLIENDSTLGRYWMEHPHFTLGAGFVATSFLDDTASSQRKRVFLSPAPSTMIEYQILNCGLRVREMESSGREVIEDLAQVAPEFGRKALDLYDRKLVRGVQIRAAWEQEPVSSNRISLGMEKDSLGVPRTHLHWCKNELDRKTAQVSAQILGEYLAEENLGRVRLDPWVLGEGDFPTSDEIAGNHHMGGTRMADTADTGVVDRNCKVFGQSNLYVAGSSVFPSCGHTNPTLTIVQLSLRLGHHLKSKG